MSVNDEQHVLIHSLRDANMPKFLAEDVPLFESIMDDLFPGIKPPEPDQGQLCRPWSRSAMPIARCQTRQPEIIRKSRTIKVSNTRLCWTHAHCV